MEIPKITRWVHAGGTPQVPVFHKNHILGGVFEDCERRLLFGLWTLDSHHTLNEFNLVQTRSVKVGGLYVVAVPVGQDHCWMMPRS